MVISRSLLFVCVYANVALIPVSAAEPVTRSPNGLITQHDLSGRGATRSPYRQVPNEILVKFRDSTPAISRMYTHMQLGTTVVREYKGVKGLQLIKLPRGMSQTQALKAFSTRGVVYAEPNYILNASATPNDTRFSEQWATHNTGQTGGVADADIDAPEAWDVTTGSPNAVVAVIDSGVDYNHPDLAGNLYRNVADCNVDGVDNDGNGYVDDCYGIDSLNGDSDPMDDNGHGTHVAGIVGAIGDNAAGVSGVNWSASVLSCKFLNASGEGTTAGALACLDYVASLKDRGVNIVATNNSWGGGARSQALRDAVESHLLRGILFVAAAGNEGIDNDMFETYPCSLDLPNVICVSSTGERDIASGFSNFGRRRVHLAAPGERILSTFPTAMGSYQLLDGTSMAAPHVTGAAALIHALYPGTDWRIVKNRILASGDMTPVNLAFGQLTITGRRLNLHRALTCSTSTILSRIRPIDNFKTTSVGVPIGIAVLHINCGMPNGSVTMNVLPTGETVTLLDDGIGTDAVAGDGVYSGTWTPTQSGEFTIRLPDGPTGDPFTISVDADLQPGFPVRTYHSSGIYYSGPIIHTLVANIDNGPGLEIIVPGLANGPLYAWNSTGQVLTGWPILTAGVTYVAAGELSTAYPGNEVVSAAIGYPGIVGLPSPELNVHTGAGAILPGWPAVTTSSYVSPVSLSDVDGDGLDEVFIKDPAFDRIRAQRASGTSWLPGWPVPLSPGGSGTFTPTIADIDADGYLDIIYSDAGALYARRYNGTILAGFPIALSNISVAPLVGDVDGDGSVEIVVGTGSVFTLVGGNGVIRGTIPFSDLRGAPALADLDGDGAQEIIFQTERLDAFYARWDAGIDVLRANGSHYPGWPVVWSGSWWTGNSSPVVGDVDGDGLPDIVATSQYPGSSATGVVRVHGRDGTSHPRFPKILPIGSGAVPAIADIDGDGRNEIVVAGSYWGGYTGYYDKVWVYDLGGSNHGPVLWGQYRGNAKHTGTAIAVTSSPATNYSLTVSVSAGGVVTSSPGGINCGSDCTENYLSGTPVLLTAAPTSGYLFNGWSGACSGGSLTCSVMLDANKTVTADFVRIQYVLSVSRVGAGQGTITSSPSGVSCGTTCAPAYDSGTSVTLTATPLSGSTFAGWSGGCFGVSLTCTVSMTSAKSVVARFDRIAYSLSVGLSGIGIGMVASSPSGINCGNVCSAQYNSGTAVTLTATPTSGSTFVGWSGDCSGQSNQCTVSMISARTVTAEFTVATYMLSISRSGAGVGTVSSNPAGVNCGSLCTVFFNTGTQVTLSATPGATSTFAGWGGACSGQNNPCNLTIDATTNVTASFNTANTENSGGSGSGSGGGGGCTISRNGEFDPLLPLMLMLAVFALYNRRCRSSRLITSVVS